MDTGIWHKCSDLMPEETSGVSNTVLVTNKDGYMWLDHTKLGKWESKYDTLGFEVYAWTELPEFNLK